MHKRNIAIITQNDTACALSVWERSIPVLKQEGYDIAGLWCCEMRLPKIKKCNYFLWFLKTFGMKNSILVSVFGIICKTSKLLLSLLGKRVSSFSALCNKENIPYFTTKSPNDLLIVDWISMNKIDIILITVDEIIKEPLLSAPGFGIINKHNSFLPGNRGPFPYLWTKINAAQFAISFHKVIAKVDSGDILYQEIVASNYTQSLVRFNWYSFINYSRMLLEAINNLAKGISISVSTYVAPSCNSFPCKADYKEFSKKGKIIRLIDLILAAKL